MEAANPAELAIDMQGVAAGSLRDQTRAVVEDVNWQVAMGDYWVLAGLQGAGKSDFLMMTGGLMPPLAGSYKLFGEDMPIFEEGRLRKRLRMGLAFETGQLFNHLTVGENIALPLRYHENLGEADAHRRAQPFLDAMELAPWASSTPGALGRNWQKRVGLARALVLNPELLLVDSPLTGLDLRHVSWWRGFLQELSRGHELMNRRPVTLVVSAADLRPWRDRARQIAILKDKHLSVFKDWFQLDEKSGEMVHELLAT
jgi:ABC-type transporter Mla maintaining outer membrane lipid asymmetry ATPase subunit MlaF